MTQTSVSTSRRMSGVTRTSALFVLALSSLTLLSACGGALSQRGGEGEHLAEIQKLREQAVASPRDAALWTKLASAEMLNDGGEIDRVASTLKHARELAPTDVRLLFLAGLYHEQQGRPEQAFAAYLEMLSQAVSSDDALTNALVEVASVGVMSLRSDVVRYDERAKPVLAKLVDEPGKLGLTARYFAAMELSRIGLRDGEKDAPKLWGEKVGCVTKGRAVGPFGPHRMLWFDKAMPGTSDATLKKVYDLGPGRKKQTVFDVETERCALSLKGGDESGAGGWWLEFEVEASAPNQVLLFDTHYAMDVYVDGESRAQFTGLDKVLPAVRYLPLSLSSGKHLVRIKLIATQASKPRLTVVFDQGKGGYDPMAGAELPQADRPFEAYLRARVAGIRQDSVTAREALYAYDRKHATAAMLLQLAEVEQSYVFTPQDQSVDRARRLLERAAKKDPDAFVPAWRLAHLQQGDLESLRARLEVGARFPLVPSIQLAVAQLLEQQDRLAEADAIIERVRSRLPDACDAVQAEYGMLRSRQHVVEANALVETLVDCDAKSSARFTLRLRQRDWDGAKAELTRLKTLLDEEEARRLELSLALATSDDERAREIREAIRKDNEEDGEGERPLAKVDELLADGKRTEALRVLTDAIDEEAGAAPGLSRVQKALTGKEELDRYREDGLAAIRRYEASGRSYPEYGAVLVFDYMVTRIFEDGSAQHLVHQIFRIQSEEAIEQFGQLRLGGRLLALRTIKPDGRILEPDEIAGLDSIAMPDLAIGDYVEYEYIRGEGGLINGGFQSSGWWFQSREEPFDISKMVVVRPKDMPLTIEATQAVPAPVEKVERDLKITTWTVEESRPIEAEPDYAPRPEVLPFLRFAFDAPWEVYYQNSAEAFAGADLYDPVTDRLVASIVAKVPASDVRGRVRALRDWVYENIEEANTRDGLAARMIAARQGDRTLVLRYMLHLAGVDARYVQSRVYGQKEPSEIISGGVYVAPLIQVSEPGAEPFFVWVAEKWTPLGYLPPALRGQQAFVVGADDPLVTLPAGDPNDDLRDVRVQIRLQDGGAARVDVRETFTGSYAVYWRQQLEQVPEEELPRQFEAGYAAREFPGAVMRNLRISGQKDAEGALVFEYALDVPMLGRKVGKEQRFGGLFAFDPARALATVSERKSTQRVWAVNQRVTMLVSGPAAVPRTSSDGEVALDANGVAKLMSSVAGDTLKVERTLRIKRALVTADAYPRFADFCRKVTELEAADVVVPLR